MANINDVREDLAERAEITRLTRPGDIVEAKYNNAVKSVGNSIWKNIWKIATGGFGKGALLTGLAVIAVTALVVGFAAASGNFWVPGIAGIQLGTVEQGIAAGIGHAIALLTHTSGIGLAVMGLGGAVGATIAIRNQRKELSASDAESLAVSYKASREKQPEVTRAPEPVYEPTFTPSRDAAPVLPQEPVSVPLPPLGSDSALGQPTQSETPVAPQAKQSATQLPEATPVPPAPPVIVKNASLVHNEPQSIATTTPASQAPPTCCVEPECATPARAQKEWVPREIIRRTETQSTISKSIG